MDNISPSLIGILTITMINLDGDKIFNDGND